MRKKIACVLSCLIILLSVAGCKNNNNAPSESTSKKQEMQNETSTNKPKEFTKKEDLPIGKVKYEFLGDGKTIEKDFKEDSNYNTITELVNKFTKAITEIDYTKEDTYFAYRNYINERALENEKKKNDQETIEKFKEKKIQIEYIKTNIENVVFNSYSNDYFIECSTFLLIKNEPSVTEQNKFYQSKYYLSTKYEDDKHAISAWSGNFAYVRAESEIDSSPLYLVELNEDAGIYLNSNNLDEMKDLQNAKKSLEGFLKLYFNQNHKNTDGVKDNLLSYISNDSKENLTPTIDKSINEVKEQEGFLELKDTNFRLIDYKSYENTYAFMVDVIYNTSNNETLRVPIVYYLNNENGNWKINKIQKIGYNFIASQNNQ